MKKKLLVLVGPTGIGKTAFSIQLAQQYKTEIINADSRQVYKEMRVGTAVPTLFQLGQVPHHLVQHKSIHDYYSAYEFEIEALNKISELFAEHNILILAGGSGMYVDAVCQGIDDLPSVDPQLRQELKEKYDREGIESLRFALKRLDRQHYAQVDLANPKRMLKAVEVSIQTGKPYSSFLTRTDKKREFEILKIGLYADKTTIDQRINQRVDEMMQEGLLEEAEALLPYQELNALNTVGYKELFGHLKGQYSLEEAVEKIKHNTRIFAKKQLTWFKKDLSTYWHHIDKLPTNLDTL